MGRTRKGLRAKSAGIGFATATILVIGQAGAAHAPAAPPAVAPVALAAAASVSSEAGKAGGDKATPWSAEPFRKLKIKVPPADLRLGPALKDSSYARLALGPLSFPDGALEFPGRIKPKPVTFDSGKTEVLEVGHSVSAPSAIHRAGPLDVLSGEAGRTSADAASWMAGLPLISSAHAADAESADNALGGPLSRMPIHGHILFEDTEDVLSSAAQVQLDRLVETLRANRAALEVVAYGGDRNSKSSAGLRLALRRGLAVRSYLVSRGIDHARISVRPMGGVRDRGPEARVDVFYAAS